jgi:cytidyltransferase-like protein
MGLRVFTAGTFDLPHAGHVKFLQTCAELGELTVALNTDEFITAYKGKPPIMSYEERFAVISEFGCVWDVIPNWGNEFCVDVVADVMPDVIAIGSDWARKDYYKQMGFDQDWLDSQGISLIYIPYTKGISSTELKARIAKG